MNHPVISPKKLIEVALPLDAINLACAREKSIRHGHPCTLHLWWARRPLAAARAVIFSQLVHDPEDLWRCQNLGKEPNKQVKGHWTKVRARLFSIIEDMVKWENRSNESVLNRAREEIRNSWQEICVLNRDHPRAKELFNPQQMPGLYDPFAGGGAIPLEAQRLGLEPYASDLNPVAVLINKAMIEIPTQFAGSRAVNPSARNENRLLVAESRGVAGLVQDVIYYGQWVRHEAIKKLSDLYPPVTITKEIIKERPELKEKLGEKFTVIAWLWARTVKSPNPAFSHLDVPLASTFVLCSKPGKEVYIEPVITKSSYRFEIKMGKPPADAKSGTSAGKRQAFRCLMSNTPMTYDYIRGEGKAHRLGQKLMAMVVEGSAGRLYLSPTLEHETVALHAQPTWKPDCEMPKKHRNFQPPVYGMDHLGDLFTARQLVALTTLSDLIRSVKEKIRIDSVDAGLEDDSRSLSNGGTGALAYAEAVSVYLAFALDKVADRGSSLGRWDPTPTQSGIINTFSRQALPMTWDFAESNPIGDASGNFGSAVELVAKAMSACSCGLVGHVYQADARKQSYGLFKFISTDPPYYDNICYADLSDYFYVWLRRTLREVYPEQMATISVPKAEELVASANRHGTSETAETYFLEGMTQAMHNLSEQSHPASPITIYYAFKQSETESAGTNSSGWETFLEAINMAGLALTGTWPMRTELGNRMIGSGTNALASSIVLVCRPRAKDAETISRRQFIRELNAALPLALDTMTRESEGLHSPVAPVDLSQSIIGPGMAVFSKYAAVLEADGSPMSVRTALQLINRFLAEDDFDTDTQFCLHWFEQYGWETGKFGEADTLARAKGTSVDGVKQSGVLHSAGGNVRLLKWAEYPSEWDPQADQRLPIWEVLHQLIRVFNTDGETGAAAVFAAVQSKAEAARQLAYRLYTLCERKNWAEDARAYNEVVTSWSGIESAAAKEPAMKQGELF
jgi:putative DNA methylase